MPSYYKEVNVPQDYKDFVNIEILEGSNVPDKLSWTNVTIQKGQGRCPSCSVRYMIGGVDVPDIRRIKIGDVPFEINSVTPQKTQQGLSVQLGGFDEIQNFLNMFSDMRVLFVSAPSNPADNPYKGKLENKARIEHKTSDNIFGENGWKLYHKGQKYGGVSTEGILERYLELLRCPYDIEVDNNIPAVNIKLFTFSPNVIIENIKRLFTMSVGEGHASMLLRLQVWGMSTGENEGTIYVSSAVAMGDGENPDVPPELADAQSEGYLISKSISAERIRYSRGPVLLKCGNGRDETQDLKLPPCAERGYRAWDKSTDASGDCSKIDPKLYYKTKHVVIPNDSSVQERLKAGEIAGSIITKDCIVMPDNGNLVPYKVVAKQYQTNDTTKNPFAKVTTEIDYCRVPDIIKEVRETLGLYVRVGDASNSELKWYDRALVKTVTNEYSSSSDKDVSGGSGMIQKLYATTESYVGIIGYSSKEGGEPTEEGGTGTVIYKGVQQPDLSNHMSVILKNIDEGVEIKTIRKTFGEDGTNIITTNNLKETVESNFTEGASIKTIDKNKCPTYAWPILGKLKALSDDLSLPEDGQTSVINIGLIPSRRSCDELIKVLDRLREYTWMKRVNLQFSKVVVFKSSNPNFSYTLSVDFNRPSTMTKITITTFHRSDPLVEE